MSRTFVILVVALAAFFALSYAAPPSLRGRWKGFLLDDPEITEWHFNFTSKFGGKDLLISGPRHQHYNSTYTTSEGDNKEHYHFDGKIMDPEPLRGKTEKGIYQIVKDHKREMLFFAVGQPDGDRPHNFHPKPEVRSFRLFKEP